MYKFELIQNKNADRYIKESGKNLLSGGSRERLTKGMLWKFYFDLNRTKFQLYMVRCKVSRIRRRRLHPAMPRRTSCCG